jgi:hypothetical protein
MGTLICVGVLVRNECVRHDRRAARGRSHVGARARRVSPGAVCADDTSHKS